MSAWTFLTVESVKAIHQEVLAAHGGAPGLRDEALLESAVAAPQASMMGQPMFTDAVEIAAAYLYYLCCNHAFIDGNKRVALASCLVFLEQNGLLQDDAITTHAVDAWETMVLDVASGGLSREDATKRLQGLLVLE